MKRIRTNRRRRMKLKNVIACLTALSVVMGSSAFVMAAEDTSFHYKCGHGAHTHSDANHCYEDVLDCAFKTYETAEDLKDAGYAVFNCGGSYGAEKDEHTHTQAGCYKLACGVTEENHTHSVEGGCYDEGLYTPVLACTTEVHVHGAADNKTPCDSKVCAIPEEPQHNESCGTDCTEHTAHVHTSDCNAECTVPAHTHTSECPHESVRIPDCGVTAENHQHKGITAYNTCYVLDSEKCSTEGHTHTDDCYVAKKEQQLVTGDEYEWVITGHIHSDSCYLKDQLTCTTHVHIDEGPDACAREYYEADATKQLKADIMSIGSEENPLSREAVSNARTTYDNMFVTQKQFVSDAVVAQLAALEAKIQAVDTLENDIAALAPLKQAVTDAQTAVTNAQNEIADEETAVADAQAAYDADPTEETLNALNAAKAALDAAKAAAGLADKVAALETAKTTLATEANKAKAAYEGLRYEQQLLVSAEKKAALTEALKVNDQNAALKEVDYKAEKVIDLIRVLPEIETITEDEVATVLAKAQAAKASYVDLQTTAPDSAAEVPADMVAKANNLVADLEKVKAAQEKLAVLPTVDELNAVKSATAGEDKATLDDYKAKINAAYTAYTSMGTAASYNPAGKDYSTFDLANIIQTNNNLMTLYRILNPNAMVLGTVQPAVAKGVNVKVFNYNNSINSGYTLANNGYKFYNGSANTVDGTASSGGYNSPVMQDKLVNGYPATTAKGSMDYIFNGSGSHEEYSMTDGGGLFQWNGKSFYYDSRLNAAAYDRTAGKFVLYDAPVLPSHKVTHTSELGGNFLPFNMLDIDHLQKTPNAPGTYSLYNQNTDLWFGMSVDFEFMMPKGGQVNGEDMVFTFTGDDDVFVYIDGKLVLDIGGCHAARGGSINFKTGVVTDHPAGGSARTRTLTWLKDLEPYTTHDFDFFYLERGGNISSCEISFNMPTLPNNSLTVGKVVEDSKAAANDNFHAQTADYKFRVLELDANGNPYTGADEGKLYITPGTKYTIKENDVYTNKTGEVDEFGYFTLKHGQQAVFENLPLATSATADGYTKYLVEEQLPADLVDLYEKVSFNGKGTTDTSDLLNNENKHYEFVGVQSTKVDNTSSQVMVFTNKVDVDKLSALQITKAVKNDSNFDANKKFDIEVVFGENKDMPLEKGTVYTVTKAGAAEGTAPETRTVETAGIIKLAAGETALITGILGGSVYTVTEVGTTENPANGGFYATYAYPASVTGEDGTVTEYTETSTECATGTLPMEETTSVEILNQSNQFGFDILLKKAAIGVLPNEVYNFDFELTQVDRLGKPVENGITDTESIRVDGPVVEETPAEPENGTAGDETTGDEGVVVMNEEGTTGDETSGESPSESVPAVGSEDFPDLDNNQKEVAYGGGDMSVTFDRNTPSGTYYFKVVEKAHDYEEFLPNDQEFIIEVVIDQSADPRIVSVKVNGEATDVAVLNFINTNVPDVPVSVNKVWRVDSDGVIPKSIDVEFTLNGEVVEVVKLSDANSWTHTWLIQDGDTWAVRELTELPEFKTTYEVGEFATTIVNAQWIKYEPSEEEDKLKEKEEEGEVLGAEDIFDEDVPLAALPEEEDGMVLGAEDEEEGMVAGIADTGDSKAIIFAGAGMLAAVAGIAALRKRKED